MGFEAPAPLPAARRPEIQKETSQELPQLSQEELAVLYHELEELDRGLQYDIVAAGEDANARRKVVKLKERLTSDPWYIRQGIHHAETRVHALSIISFAREVPIDWHRDFDLEYAKAPEYYDEEIEKDKAFYTSLNAAVLAEREELRKDLNNPEDSSRDVILKTVSGILDSPVETQREEASAILLENLPLLQELLYKDFDNPNKSDIAAAWRNILLYSDKKNLKQVWGALSVIWEANKNKDWVELYRKLFMEIFWDYREDLEVQKDFAVKSAIDLAGLDGSEVMRKWMLAGDDHLEKKHGPSHQYAYGKNLKGLYELKQQSSEAPRILYEDFGVAHFGRYKTEMLLRQAKRAERDDAYGVVIYPETDYNGAFFQSGEALYHMSLQLQSGMVETRIVEAGSQKELARRLVRLHKKYSPAGNKFAFAVIGGHGSKDSITLGEDKRSVPPPLRAAEQSESEYENEMKKWHQDYFFSQDKERFTTKDILEGKGINRAFKEWFEEGAPKVLVSCSTGTEGGIAETASGQISGEITAPKIPTNVENIEAHVDEDGKITISVTYREGDTGRYASGKPVKN